MSTNQANSGVLQSREDFEDNPRGQFRFWQQELQASQRSRRNWHKQGDKIVSRYKDDRQVADVSMEMRDTDVPFRLNLFHSNVTTLMSMLYGNVPKVDVSRRYADSSDDVARVAAEIMERLLNNDVADNGEEYNAVLRGTLQDRLLSGLGCGRVRYEVETERVEAAVVDLEGNAIEGDAIMQERTVNEEAKLDYFYWRDVLWGWCRSWADMPWLAYRVYLNFDEASALFGEDAANNMEFKAQMVTDEEDGTNNSEQNSPWQKTEVWEIWDKETRKIMFVNLSGPQRVLKTVDDELGLSGFFPSAPFFLANPTTTLYEPVPDYHLAQDLYNEIDELQTRIAIITEAVKVVGVYDSGEEQSVGRMFKEGVENTLIPVENWALFGEKGGLAGSIDWVPIADIVNALDKLKQTRDETIQLLYQVTGMNDIMRGGSQGQYEGVGQAQLQAKFGSVRVQALQDEFARFASDLLQLKAEVIAKHFEPERIAQMANMQNSHDVELVPEAIKLIKSFDQARLRIEIRPESVAMVDYAQLKSERTEYINALSTFMQSSAPLIEQNPEAEPLLLQLLQWGLAGFKGAQEIEGVIDKAIEAAQQKAQEPEQEQPDPAQVAAEMAQNLEQMKQQGELAKIQAKAQADQMAREQDKQADIETIMAQTQAKLQEINAELQAAVAETQTKLEADILLEQVQAQSNMAQQNNTVQGEIQKDVVEAELDIAKEQQKTANKITEIAQSASAKIEEQNSAAEQTPDTDE